MKANIAILGTGRMGSALAGAFLDAGHRVTIWNRTKEKGAPLVARGARLASTVAEAVAAAELVVVNVNDYGTSDRLLRAGEVTGALGGKLLVQLTSGSPRQAREATAWAAAHGVGYLDGAIMGTPNFIGTPGGTILYAGARAHFDTWRPVLLALGGNSLYVGSDVGHASALDSALLVFMWGAMFGALQGVAISEAEHIPVDAYLGYIKAFAPVVDGAIGDFVQRIQQGRFASDETTLATLDAHAGALQHLLELGRERGIRDTIPAAFDQLFQEALKAGHGQDDFAVLRKLLGGNS